MTVSKFLYSLDAQPVREAEVKDGKGVTITFPPLFGYVTFEVWVYDLAGNEAHETYWYLLERGNIVSIQPVYDGRYRLEPMDCGHDLTMFVSEWKVEAITADYLRKVRDWISIVLVNRFF